MIDKTKDIKSQEKTPDAPVTPTAQGPVTPTKNPPQVAVARDKPAKPRRTRGLWLFDVLLYPFLTNFAVFGISVAATYLTNKGAMRDTKTGELVYGKVGEWFHNRGKGVVNFFKNFGMTHAQADMSKMVFFSFADGSLMAPVVKKLEDYRIPIAKWFDDRLGTRPKDEDAAYQAEPKQSWLSVLLGRFAVASIVVPTAVLLDKIKWKGENLNDKFFNNPGKKFGEWIAGKPSLAKYFGKLDIPELGKVGLFEAFYTTVCTGGLYVSSRFLARHTGQKNAAKTQAPIAANGKDVRPENAISKIYDKAENVSDNKLFSNRKTIQKKNNIPAPAENHTDVVKAGEFDHPLAI